LAIPPLISWTVTAWSSALRRVARIADCLPNPCRRLKASGYSNTSRSKLVQGDVESLNNALIELSDVAPDRLLGDKGYDIRDLTKRGIEPVIPLRSNRKTPIEYDHEAYKRRNLIERCVNRLKPLSWLAKIGAIS
jgi:hypothetical protein